LSSTATEATISVGVIARNSQVENTTIVNQIWGSQCDINTICMCRMHVHPYSDPDFGIGENAQNLRMDCKIIIADVSSQYFSKGHFKISTHLLDTSGLVFDLHIDGFETC
jgi:hypothetical protein